MYTILIEWKSGGLEDIDETDTLVEAKERMKELTDEYGTECYWICAVKKKGELGR